MCVQNLKFVGLPIPEIIGCIPKMWEVPGSAHAPFSPKVLMGVCSDGPCKCSETKFEVRSFTRSCDNSDWTFGFGGGIANPNLVEQEAV